MTYETSQEIRQALQDAREQPHGAIRCAVTEELTAAAEQLGDDTVLVTALCELMNAYEFGAEPAKLPVTLARLLKIFDGNRGAFGDWEVHRLHWFFKWVTSALLELPDVPIQAARDWVGQMQDRYAAAGLKMQAVSAMRYQIAEHTGVDLDAAYEEWSTRPRDQMSDCEACEARIRGGYYALRGDDTRALREWQPVLDGRLSCSEEPAWTTAAALASLVRTNALAEAASAHRSGYRMVRGNVNLAVAAGRHIEFCARTGNCARGAELLAHSRGYFAAAPRTLTDLRFLGSVQVLLARLVADGHGGMPVAGPPGAAHTAGPLLDLVARDGAELAARFDARNGTAWLGGQHRARCAAQPLTSQPLPLGLRAAAPVPPRQAAGPAAPAAAPAGDPGTDSFAGLLARARELSELGRPDAEPLWDRIAALAAGAGTGPAGAAGGVPVDDVLRGELASHRGYRAARAADWAQARDGYAQARQAFEAAAEPGRALAAAARYWRCVLAPGASVDPAAASSAWAGLDEAKSRACELLDAARMKPDHYLTVIHARVLALMEHPAGSTADAPGADPHAQVSSECEHLRTEALRLGVPDRAAVALVLRADMAAGHGQFDAAEAGLRQAVGLLREAGRPWLLPRVCCFLAQVLNRAGRPQEARAMAHEALTAAAKWPDEDFSHGGALMILGEACRLAGDLGAAAGHFADAASWFDRGGNLQAASVAQATLGQALLASGRAGDAVAVLESLRDGGEDTLDSRQRAQARLDLGRGLRQLGENRAAAGEFVWLADYVAGWGEEPEIFVMVVGELAAALAGAGLWEQADAAIGRAMSAHAATPHPAVICHMLRKVAEYSMRHRGADAIALTLSYLSRADEVNGAATEVPGRYRRWPETAQTAELRARALAEAGRNEDSLAAAEISLRAYETGGDQTLSQQAEMTRVAAIVQGLRLGQQAPAIARLTPMIGRCQAAGLADQAAQLAGLRTELAG